MPERPLLRVAAVCVAALALSGCEARLSLGARCAYASECPIGLVCALGRCRDACLTHRDCEVGSACLADEATGGRACRVLEEAGCAATSDCGAGLVCEGAACVQPCADAGDCLGLVCVDAAERGRVCVAPTGAECAAGADCPWGVCVEGRCDAVRALAAGLSHTCVLLESGAVECAGGNSNRELADDAVRTHLTRFTRLAGSGGGAAPLEAMAIGTNHACAVASGEVRCWGAGYFGQTGGPTTPTPPLPLPLVGVTDVREVSAAVDHSCARREDEILCWGTDRFGLLGDAAEHPGDATMDGWRARPAPVEVSGRFVDLDTGYYHACAVTTEGEVWCWGANDHLNLGLAPSGTTCTSTVAAGTPIACEPVPVRVPGVGPAAGIVVDRVTVGLRHTCVLARGGAVHCWGGNDHGQVGNGTPSAADVASPFRVLEGATDVQAGSDHACALLGDGRVACWGRDASAQLGDGGGGPRPTPVYVRELDDAVAIAIGDAHGCALRTSGEVWCWGSDHVGQLGDGSPEPISERAPTPFPVRTTGGAG